MKKLMDLSFHLTLSLAKSRCRLSGPHVLLLTSLPLVFLPLASAFCGPLDRASDALPGSQSHSAWVPAHPLRTDALVWTTKSPAPLKRYWGAVGTRLDTIYLAGGRDSLGSTSTMLAYVPGTDTWIAPGQPQTPDMPEARRAGATGFNDTLMFYSCGRDTTDAARATTYLFNMRSKTWSSGADCPHVAWSTAGAVAGNYFLQFGSELKGDTLFQYDINAGYWSVLLPASRPTGRAWLAAAGAGGLFYIFGGADPQNNLLRDCWAFDPQTASWTQKADMPGPRIYHSAVSVGDSLIIVAGGKATGIGYVDGVVYVYYIATDSWTTETSMATARGWQMMAWAGDRVYALQGSDVDTPTYLSVNEEGNLHGVGVEVSPSHESRVASYRVFPNPFTSYARIPGHETERFNLHDISGRKVGVYLGDRVGADVPPGVYFIRPVGQGGRPLRVVKVR